MVKPLRRTALRRTRKTPRKVKTACVTRGCKRPPTAGQWCVTHAKAKADELWGKRIRTGECEVAGMGNIRCAGPNQALHGISRGYMGTRYSLENGFSGCAAHNLIGEVRPLEWDEWLRHRWGAETYQRLRDLALNFGKKGEHVDYATVIEALASNDQVVGVN